MATATRYLGTCPVCYREQKLHPDRKTRVLEMVLHGYERPGYGYVNGRCFGVGWQPFEVSPDGTIAYVERVLQPALDANEQFLQRLEAGEVTELHAQRIAAGRDSFGKRQYETYTVTPADGYVFTDMLRRQTNQTQNLIRQLTEDILERTAKVRSWRELPIKTEEEVLQQRARMTDARRAVIDEARAAKQAKRAALDAKERARDQERIDLIEEYRNIFEQLAHTASDYDKTEAKRHWIYLWKRVNKKSYLHFYPHKLEADDALERLGLAVPSAHTPGRMQYSNDLGWEPRP